MDLLIGTAKPTLLLFFANEVLPSPGYRLVISRVFRIIIFLIHKNFIYLIIRKSSQFSVHVILNFSKEISSEKEAFAGAENAAEANKNKSDRSTSGILLSHKMK